MKRLLFVLMLSIFLPLTLAAAGGGSSAGTVNAYWPVTITAANQGVAGSQYWPVTITAANQGRSGAEYWNVTVTAVNQGNAGAAYWKVTTTAVNQGVAAPVADSWPFKVSDGSETVANKSSLIVATVTVAISGIPVNLASVTVPFGKSLTVKALKTNTGHIRIADNATDVIADATSFLLYSQESIELLVTNLNKIWIDVSNGGEGVTYIVEK